MVEEGLEPSRLLMGDGFCRVDNQRTAQPVFSITPLRTLRVPFKTQGSPVNLYSLFPSYFPVCIL